MKVRFFGAFIFKKKTAQKRSFFLFLFCGLSGFGLLFISVDEFANPVRDHNHSDKEIKVISKEAPENRHDK